MWFSCVCFRIASRAKPKSISLCPAHNLSSDDTHNRVTKHVRKLSFVLIYMLGFPLFFHEPCGMTGCATQHNMKNENMKCVSGFLFLEIPVQWTPIRSVSDQEKLLYITCIICSGLAIPNTITSQRSIFLKNIFGFGIPRKLHKCKIT